MGTNESLEERSLEKEDLVIGGETKQIRPFAFVWADCTEILWKLNGHLAGQAMTERKTHSID